MLYRCDPVHDRDGVHERELSGVRRRRGAVLRRRSLHERHMHGRDVYVVRRPVEMMARSATILSLRAARRTAVRLRCSLVWRQPRFGVIAGSSE